MIEGTLLYELWKYIGSLLILLAVIGFILTPYDMNYRHKKYHGELDPKKSFLENFFSIP